MHQHPRIYTYIRIFQSCHSVLFFYAREFDGSGFRGIRPPVLFFSLWDALKKKKVFNVQSETHTISGSSEKISLHSPLPFIRLLRKVDWYDEGESVYLLSSLFHPDLD